MIVSMAEARRNLSALINRVAFGRERVLLSRHGKSVAAIVTVSDALILERVRSLCDAGEYEAALQTVKELGPS